MKRLGIALIALLVGGLIYVLWRIETITMFIWFDRLGLTNLVGALRSRAGGFPMYLPNWSLFSLPNALWLFSGLLVLDLIWGDKSSASKLIWFSAFWFIAIGTEVGQSLRVIPGTFDWQDIIIMTFAGFCAHLLTTCVRRQERRQKA